MRYYPWPETVIDRHRRGGSGYSSIRNSKLFTYANNKFTHKWKVTQMFMQEDSLKRWIPETVEYGQNNLMNMLRKHQLLYIKPGNGTGGSSIVKVKSIGSRYEVSGRDLRQGTRRAILHTKSGLMAWLNHWTVSQRIRNGNFMIQQGLNLDLVPGRVSDTRLLIQKNEEGKWDVTGMGVRTGPVGSATSNLHGGGRAQPFNELMVKSFGAEKAASIRNECERLAFAVVHFIEQEFGSMMEYGLDIGIDTSGKVWLIEVNPKPGREIFKGMGNMELYRKSIERPIQYSMYLARKLRNKEKGVEITEATDEEM